MRILAYEECRDCFTGVLETGDAYWSFTLAEDDGIPLDCAYPKSRYRDLGLFQGASPMPGNAGPQPKPSK